MKQRRILSYIERFKNVQDVLFEKKLRFLRVRQPLIKNGILST